jgi:hypothetical protein
MLTEMNISGSEVSFLADPGSLTQGRLIHLIFPEVSIFNVEMSGAHMDYQGECVPICSIEEKALITIRTSSSCEVAKRA